ncbi:hypothetical protein [uncultured Dokdonia sp.]|uniref:hypothetical protein n=1 Tax=uncultured Dokdonia sp. TaxID=575653 RepID=UPI00261444AC|nr:hypothetical protein [uncultured Dokdonia sp.]
MKAKFLFFISIIISACTARNNDSVEKALEIFDSSLDSLISENTTNKSKYTILFNDTLYNNPKKVVTSFYQEAYNNLDKNLGYSYHSYNFKDNELEVHTTVDEQGGIFIEKYIYFDKKIDDSFLKHLRMINVDTFYVGQIVKYNNKGNLLKSVSSFKVNLIGDSIHRDARSVSVYKYDTINNQIVTKNRVYLQNQLQPDSLIMVPINTYIKPLNSISDTSLLSSRFFRNEYEYDLYGNWIVQRKIYSTSPKKGKVYSEICRDFFY